MKKTLLTLISVLFCAITFAQSVPQGINYQAVARDANGDVLMNQALTIQFSVISDISTGNISWQENHQDTTNDYGLFTAIIGQGTSTSAGSSATFDVIDWGASNHLLKVEVDYGSGLVDMGTTAFMSVPYALKSGNSAFTFNVNGTGVQASTDSASGNYSTAMGRDTEASGDYSTAMGRDTEASGDYSTAMGRYTEASGDYATAMGGDTEASGAYSTAMGVNTTASGSASTTMGLYTTASGDYSTAMGVNTTASGYGELYNSGNVKGLSFISTSDRRVKQNITTFSGGLSKVMLLNPKTYFYNTEAFPRFEAEKDKPQIGFIAQEVEAIFPEMVITDGDEVGLKGLRYGQLTAVLVQAIKEQQEMIDVLQQENKDFKERITQLENK